MTTKELIDEYVSAHGENRWMDASELEALLTEFAEKLKEPVSEDLEQAAIYYDLYGPALYAEDAFIEGAQWQKEQMMKDAIEGKVVAVRNVMSDRSHTYPWIELEAQLSKNDKVKVIIIKE